MNSSDFFSDENAAADRFDDALRAQLGDVEVTPEPAAWDTLRAQLAAPRPAPWRTRLATFGGGVVVGALLWWGGGWRSEHSATAALGNPPADAEMMLTDGSAAFPTRSTALLAGSAALPTRSTALLAGSAAFSTGSTALLTGSAASVDRSAALAAGSAPLVSRSMTLADRSAALAAAGIIPRTAGMAPWVLAYALDSALAHEAAALRGIAADTARAARLGALVAAQTQTLAGLQARLDSVKQFLPEAPPTLARAGDSARTDSATAAAVWPALPALRSPWAALLVAETTPGWALLPTRNPAAPATQEQTVAVLSQQVLGQWQAAPRWVLRAGVGQTTLTTQARTTAERSTEHTTVDSTRTTSVRDYGIDYHVVTIVHLDSVPHYEPKLNGSGQIDHYDTTWVSTNDTVRSVFTTLGHDSILKTTITKRTETLRERQQQQFRPTYRFWTVPVAVRYSLLTTSRWTLGAVGGAQLSVLRDAQRPVWTGEQYELRRVRADQTPYRPVSLSLSAGLEAQYRLSPRLSALFAPTVRWWAVRPARGDEGPRPLLPAAQVGLVWGF